MTPWPGILKGPDHNTPGEEVELPEPSCVLMGGLNDSSTRKQLYLALDTSILLPGIYSRKHEPCKSFIQILEADLFI